MLEPTRGENVLDIVLSSQKELVDNVKIFEPLGNSDHNKFVPFQKQGKRCRKKHLSKEAIRIIVLKQTMWRVYRRTRKEEDYANYKEALNAAKTEIRQSKRSYEQKLACNIKNDSKSFYAYVRSKQNVKDKVGPLEDSAGNIVSQGFLMAEDLNGYFSSAFTKEDISSLPVADAKFQEAKLTI